MGSPDTPSSPAPGKHPDRRLIRSDLVPKRVCREDNFNTRAVLAVRFERCKHKVKSGRMEHAGTVSFEHHKAVVLA